MEFMSVNLLSRILQPVVILILDTYPLYDIERWKIGVSFYFDYRDGTTEAKSSRVIPYSATSSGFALKSTSA